MGQAVRKNPTSAGIPSAPLASWRVRGWREAGLISLTALAAYLLLALGSFDVSDPGWAHSGSHDAVRNAGGPVGAQLAAALFSLVGYIAYLLPLMVAYGAWLVYRGPVAPGDLKARAGGFNDEALIGYLPLPLRLLGFLMTIIAGSSLAMLHHQVSGAVLPNGAGGIVGMVFGGKLAEGFDFLGATLFLLAAFLVGVTLFSSVSWLAVVDRVGHYSLLAYERAAEKYSEWRDQRRDASIAAELDERSKVKIHTPASATTPASTSASMSANMTGTATAAREAVSAKVGETASAVKAAMPKISAMFKDKPEDLPSGLSATAEPVAKVIPRSDVEVRMPDKRKAQPRKHMSDRVEGLPSLALLEPPPPLQNQYSATALENMSRQVETVLQSFNIEVKVQSVCPGPVITRFELELSPGTKVSQISNLSKDLARGLSTTSVRVVEVIAGKSVIGLEVPNQNREMVALSDVLSSRSYAEAKSPLTMGLGHDISGHPVVADLAKMPHLLVAGTTGSGKSVGVNSMLVSMLFKSGPEDVRFILIDPKMLELSIYDGIPHLLTPVVTDMKEAANALRWAVAEMERRYQLMSAMGVRNLAGCNKKILEAEIVGEPLLDPTFKAETDWEGNIPETPALEKLPQIVIVIDELADLMMVVGKKVEELIARLAQKARASGIHLILATQRPSVDVITGLIKANVPTRMAFQVSSKIDSRTILDQMGAESLLGMGDMLYLPPGTGYPTRVHGAFVDDHEVHALVEDWKSRGPSNYIEAILSGPADGGLLPGEKPEPGSEDAEQDELYDQAVAIVIESRKSSISYLQRRLKVGYNRAARLIENMEETGLISPMQSNGQREILAPSGPEM